MDYLAIKGHQTKGKEVIEILEMMGGKNNHCCSGDVINNIYFIDDYKCINSCYKFGHNYVYFELTLEEFFEKFPYKVGDKVKTIYNKISIIKQLVWSEKDNAVRYKLEDDEYSLYFANELQLYKE